ncbi:MAG: TonB-dependent receptor plug domain-containing protein [Bacteroides sp.]|nr:TonB-dependent receptor plug domain-containing protein [Bacteroides sp.]
MKHLLPILFCLFALIASAQEYEYEQPVPFNGVVTDISGKPLARVTVTRTSTGEVTRTDKKGRFAFTDVHATDTLVFTQRKGRESYAVPVDSKRSLKVMILTSGVDAREDQQLVDIGYGYIKLKNKTQARNGISGDELRRSGYSNLLQALQGRIPGLNIHTTGRPSDTGDINIRGIKSFYASSTPLFVVDGTIVDDISHISIYDIDYVEVMKEAAIYGSRGANGAILIKTKRAE